MIHEKPVIPPSTKSKYKHCIAPLISLIVYGTLMSCIVGEDEDVTSLDIVNGSLETRHDSIGRLYYKVLINSGSEFSNPIPYCTATLIGKNHVLTAKHCFLHDDTSPRFNDDEQFFFAPGEGSKAPFENAVGISKYYILNPTRSHIYDYDLAVLELKEPINNVTPIRLTASWPKWEPGYLMGFGCTASDNPTDGNKRVGLSTVTRMRSSYFETRGTSGTCPGDSGGPFMQRIDGALRQVGINSRADVERLYSVESRLDTDWIFRVRNALIQPRNLKAEFIGTNSIKLGWTRSAKDGEVEYEVTRTNEDYSQYKRLTKTSNNSIIDSSVLPHSTYRYEVFVRRNGEVSATSKIKVKTLSTSKDDPKEDIEYGIGSVQNLRGDVYNHKSLEIFWDRVDGNNVYEIRRNGSFLKETSGTSLYESGLSQNTSYEYSVRVKTSSGGYTSLGAWSKITLRTKSSTHSSSSDGETDIDFSKPRIQNLRGDVYNHKSLEIFWDRVDGNNIYEIRRNGSFIKETSGTSFYDSGLSRGTSYKYAVRVNGDSGAWSEVTLKTKY